MPLEINFNAAPYFDDYDSEKNFYRVLFKPAVAVQARELTQLQTILQDQIEKFGRHIFKDGSVIEGCTLNFDNNYQYIKVTDTATNGAVINISDYVGKKVVSAANLQALIVNIKPGLESNAPDLNTLFVRYLNSTNYANGSQQKTFDADEPIFIQTTDDINVANIAVANASYDPVGRGYAVSISEGTIFNKGFFVQVYPQTLVVSSYTNIPQNVSVGFYTSESVVTADADNTLFDNALGSTNVNAPGAARLKLTANLVVRATDTVNTTTANTTNFFSIVDFSGGVPVLQRTDAQYARLGAELARRTYEESGNYIVNPFELSISANSTNANNLVLEISKGLGYVQGYRVEYSDTNKVNLRKGTDVVDFPNQIITANYGNYVFVNEYAGLFDVDALDEVQLYANSAATVLTRRAYAPTLAPGTAAPSALQIGTAKVRAVEHFSGTPGTPTCQYKMYLFDIKITAGNYSFSDVRMIYGANPAGVVGYADTVLVGGNAILRETAAADMVFKLGAGAVRSVNTTATSFIFRTTANAAFANTGVATLSPPTPHPSGSHSFPVTGSLSETNELKFVVVPNTSVNAVAADFTVNVVSTSPNVDFSAPNTTLLTVGDYVVVGNTTTSNVRRVVSITNTTQIICDANIGFTNTVTNIARHFPAGVPISFTREDSANISISGNTATFNLGTALAGTSTFVGTFYFDVLRSGATQVAKVINKNRFVKIQANTHPTGSQGPWSLGLPDVVKIRGVYQGTTYSNTNTNNAKFFNLVTGQKGTHYDLSYIELKPNTGHTVGADDLFLVELDHFTPDYSGGIGYFSINSYPIDDINTANTAAITTQEIPVFTSDSGITYDLRDAIDARPYATNTAASSTTAAGATINPATTLTLLVGANGAYTPSPGQNFNTGFTYFIGRKDKVALSPEGKISLVEGVPAIEPVSPRDLDGTMTLGQLTIPPYPSLSQSDVRVYGRPEYGVSIDLLQNRRYTMRDIGVIDKKFARLEYYTSLSLLEASAKTAIIKDDLGAERFKNGFIVDSFKGFATSDTRSQEYKASIDYKLEELGPTVKRTYIDLTLDTAASANVVKEGNLVLLAGNTVSYIEQPFASKVRNCVENIIYVWNGNVTLSPEGDNQVDIDVNPDVVGNIDLSGLTDLVSALPSIRGSERIISTTTISESTNRSTTGNITTTTRDLTALTTETTIRSDIDFSASTLRSTFEFGELVQDVSIQQFIKPRRVNFTGANLKPNTRVFAYFDGVAVLAHCTPTDSSFVPTDVKGGDLVSDSSGIVYGYFDIPAGVFKTGDRVFRLCDVDNLVVAADSVTTQAAATYSASNISITKARYALNTRLPQVVVNSTDIVTGTRTSERVLASQVTQVISNDINRPAPVDPIAQTFTINESSEDVAGVFIKKLDLYFRTKHPTLGVEVQIREVQNGFPTLNIVPFGRKTLQASQVNTSLDASQATTFEFETPVFLQSGVEYCFVVLPVGSNEGYNIWVGEVGGTDVKTGSPIYVNNSTGVLFTSSTNRVWTPFQREDIKFVLHRKRFTANTGVIVYRNSNAEFFTAKNFKGTNDFVVGEKIYVSESNALGANVRCVDSSNAVSVVINTSFNAFSFTVNRYIYISSNTGGTTEIRHITGIPNTTHIVLNDTVPFTDNNASIGYLQSNGDLFGYLTRFSANNELLYIDQSTANVVSGFTNVAASGNALLIGAESRAIANLVSVDNIDYSVVVPQFSYVSPPGTTFTLNMKGISAAASTLESSNTQINSDIETFFTDRTRRIRSRSRELQDGANKGMFVSIPITTASDKVSPIVDDIKTDMLVFENIVGNSAAATSETSPGGGAGRAKYVSKRVALAEGQDAEDLQVYLNAYKPSNTDITVYAKFLSGQDSESIDTKAWSPLSQNTASSVVSSRVDRNDFKEFMYDMPYKYSVNAASSTAMADWAIYGTFGNTAVSANVITVSNSTPLAIGSLVYFIGVNVATGISNGFYNILTANTTAIKLSAAGTSTEVAITPVSSNNSGTLYHIPLTAFKDEYLGNVVSYYTRSGAHYHSYKTFAIKILMTSEEGSHIVPRVTDMRAIALQS